MKIKSLVIITILILAAGMFPVKAMALESDVPSTGVYQEKTLPDTETEQKLESEDANAQKTETAGSEDDTEETEETETPPADIRLKIEDTHIYSGMEKAYKDGYEPEIKDDQVHIVLPVAADESGRIETITVTPDLGDTTASPFVYKNYQKSFKATDEIVDSGKEKQHVFLVDYTFALNSGRMNGIYPVIFNVAASDGYMNLSQSFTVYVRITDGQSPDTGDGGDVAVSDSSEETPTSEPKVIITKCTSSPENIEAGSEFSLLIELKNTSTIKYVQNMTIEVTCADAGLNLLEDSHTFYFDRLGTEETLELPLRFKAGSNMTEGRYDIQLAMSYDNPDAVSLSSSGTLSVDVRQPLKIELESSDFPESMNAGDTVTLSVQALNLGRGKIYNARCTIDVPGLSAGTSAFLGNLDAGSAVSGELKIFAGMKDEAVYGSAYGETSGQLILEYEDEDGNSYSIEKNVSTEVKPLVINAPEEAAEEDAGIGMQWIIGVVVIALVLAGITIISLYIKKKRNR